MVFNRAVQLVVLLTAGFTGAQAWQQPPAPTITHSPHGALDIPCQNCHTANGWKPIRSIPEFDHNKTGYRLTGMHRNVACQQCHTSPVFSNVGNKCADCHADIHRREMPGSCERCHTTNGWVVSRISTREIHTRFPLIGAHATLDCDACHKNAAVGQFQGLSPDCVTCHADLFRAAKSPLDHVALNFPGQCQLCHRSLDTWMSASFDHSFTGFPLTGAHAGLNCTACHANGFTPQSTECVSCHLRDFNATTNPNHVAAGFPQQCFICHSTVAWQPATFDHSKTGFPLTGAHATLQCASCHIGGRYAGTPADCYSCHRTEYQGTTNPNHVAAGFPTTCQTCHTTTTWAGATFNHTWFPIPHHTAQMCSDCHTNPSDYSVFLCTNCHTQAQTTAQHADVKGFVWNSINCYACHKSGGGGG